MSDAGQDSVFGDERRFFCKRCYLKS